MFKLGSTTIEKVVDMDLNGMTLQKLLPALDDKVLDRHPEWLPEGTVDADGHALLSIHSWLVRHQGLTILIDAGAGNDKPRPQQPELDHLSNPFLERLAAAGAWPEEVDVVLHTLAKRPMLKPQIKRLNVTATPRYGAWPRSKGR